MNHLKKFEELDYSTYKSASSKIKDLGQKDKALAMMSHANDMEKKKIDHYRFDMLVGEVKSVPNATFKSLSISRESNAFTILAVFESGENNSHRVNSVLHPDGSLEWKDNNKFANRKSTNNFLIVVKALANYQPDFVKLLEELHLKSEELTIMSRTYYI